MARVIFVGMHNKPGMLPLDSKTKTGKIVDRIIAELGSGFECVKTNLIDAESLPVDAYEISRSNHLWLGTTLATNGDIAVLLGAFVVENFWWDTMQCVHLKHPASCFGKEKTDAYIESAVSDIWEAHEAILRPSSECPT